MDEEDQDKVQWMRSVYREVPLDSPVLKRVKVSNVHRQLKLRYAVHVQPSQRGWPRLEGIPECREQSCR